MEIGKVPPHDIEAEQAVLGSCLTDKDAVMDAVEKLRPESFYREDSKLIFEAIFNLYNRSEPVDLVTVKDELTSMGSFENIGGYEYLATLPDKVPTTTNVQKYGFSAEFSAKQDLGQYCRENELQVKAIEENDGIYIVKCTTTNQNLIAQYGSSTFYYGYMPSASGSTYRHYTDTSKQKVYDILNK